MSNIDMKSTQYLYDCDASEFMDLPYRDALKFKVDKCIKLMTKLRIEATATQEVPDVYTALLVRYTEVEKAKYFNRKLIEGQ